MGIPKGSTPRSSGRLREKSQKKFEMPTRDHVLGAIQTTPGKSYEQYKPRKLINNFLKERNTYNNRYDPMEMTDDEEGFSDFIVEDGPSSFESRAKKREKKKKKEKKRKKMEQWSESSSEEMSDFIVEDEPPPSRRRRNRKTTKHTTKTEYSSESGSDNKEVSSDSTEEDEESGIQQSAKKTTKSLKRMKRMLSSSDSESDNNDGVTPSRRSNRISRQPKKKFEKPNKKKAWENILEREPDLRETVDSDDVADFVVGDEEVEEDVSDAETDVQANVDEDGDICEKSDTEKEGNTQGDDKLNNHKNPGETDLSHSVGDKLIKTDEDLSRKQEDIEKETDVRNQSTPPSSVSKKTDLVEAEWPSDDCESDSECTKVGRKFRSKVHHRRQVIKALDSDVSESDDDDEKINVTFVGRKRRRTSTNLNFDEDGDESDDDRDGGGREGEEMKGDEEEKGETR